MNCKFMIVEKKYIDKYYLDDYIHFYANCYREYKRTCNRVHFFTKQIDPERIFDEEDDSTSKENSTTLENPGSLVKTVSFKDEIQSAYLGFVVIRPITNMHVGRTLLSVYSSTNTCEEEANKNKNRNIIAIHDYHSNLCDIDLIVKSVPFQEQDDVIHACATTAIWTVLEQSAHIFKYYTPTPYEIKISAPNYSNSRPIPTSRLNILEMIGAIRSFGMEIEIVAYESDEYESDEHESDEHESDEHESDEHESDEYESDEYKSDEYKSDDYELVEFESDKHESDDYESNSPKYHTFSSFIYAFLRGGFPILLSVDIFDSSDNFVGGHALAVLGYELSKNQPELSKGLLTGNRIEKLFIHDDNLGPFARFYITEKLDDEDHSIFLICENKDTIPGSLDKIIPDAIIAPIYHKIRYPYLDIADFLIEFLIDITSSNVISEDKSTPDEFRDILEWDIYLISVNKLKECYRGDDLFVYLPKPLRKKILSGYFPRFIWRCRLMMEGLPLIEILGDATEAQTQFPFFCAFCYTEDLKNEFFDVFDSLEWNQWKEILI